MTNNRPIGIVLLQLGGPDSLEAVEPFLYNLFCDPDIIDLPFAFLFRKPLARFISSRRAPKVQEYYRRIGRKSPILKLTVRQARALERALQGKVNCKSVIAMRYWHPMTDEAIEEIRKANIERVLLLPLYPHYSKTTTGSSVNEWKRMMIQKGISVLQSDVVVEYCEHPLYIKGLIRNINIALKRVKAEDRSKVNLVFSAHGTPVKLVKSGDPYQSHIIRTYNAVVKEGNFGIPHHLCYQSKVGPEKWLEPSLDDTIRQLANEKVTHMIVIPIAFVSDHSETLWEINIEARQEAKHLGIKHFDMSPGLNTNPYFIQALADIVEKKVKQWAA
jgi:protoporphyrin/coproporphyrin ferrochelatase